MRTRLLLPLLLLTLSACGARSRATTTSEPAPSASSPSSGATGGLACALEGNVLRQRSDSACAESLWRFARTGDGQWNATEEGCANATGTARLEGRDLVLDITYDEGAARYTWTLDSACTGTGRLAFTAGPFAGQTFQSQLSPAE